ncbi:hypothetical protein GCM10010532_104800 [Dactylosporangium siamense]|uniref:Uncharacterized protein n=2 Tax=Dactylosporangium siamense TaxID=685454 RepID=A0A919UIH5_9ACTN|nr:hypothetical protein Dsi01nite_097290 [Dactylosporangium siamense]
MQTAIASDVVSVATGANRVALFANPFRDNREEALIVDATNKLTYLQRSGSDSGWEQTPLNVAAEEVVTVVHRRDLSVWAVYTVPGDRPAALRLTRSVTNGVTTCAWEAVSGAIAFQDGPLRPNVSLTGLTVAYNGVEGIVSGLVAGRHAVATLAPTIDGPWFVCASYLLPGAGNRPDEVAGTMGFDTSAPGTRTVFYLRSGTNVQRWDVMETETTVVATNATALVGTFHAPGPALGCLYLTAGNLVSWHRIPATPSYATTTTPVDLTEATVWTDSVGMMHVYGLNADRTLKVLHQASWKPRGAPVWAQSVPATGPARAAEPVPACVGLTTHVVEYAVDPFPDFHPTVMTRRTAPVRPDEQFGIHTQDLVTARWTTDNVRKPATSEAPHTVNRYVSQVTLLDQQGAPMPGFTVQVSAETLVEVEIAGVSHLIGPGRVVPATTNMFGRVMLSTPADSLLPATLHVDAVGLHQGAVIQPAAAVHGYLAGTGTLTSVAGTFDKYALAPLVRPGMESHAEAAANGVKNLLRMADGKAPVSALDRHGRRIHGFAVGDHVRSTASGVPGYVEFDNPQDAADHLAAIRARPDYGGILELAADFAGDVWEGIKSGAIEVTNVAVAAVTRIWVTIAGKTVELVTNLIDGLDRAVRAAEATLAWVVTSIDAVTTKLCAVFNFDHIWKTKTALQDGFTTILKYGAETVDHFATMYTDGWFAGQKATLTGVLDRMSGDYGVRRVGDAGNQVPTITDANRTGTSTSHLFAYPQVTWLFDRALGEPMNDLPVVDKSGVIAGATDRFMTALTGSGVVAGTDRVLVDKDRALGRVTDTADPDAVTKASVSSTLDMVGSLADPFVHAADAAVRAGVALVDVIAKHLDDVLTTPATLGQVNDVYGWFRSQAKQPEAQMTLGDLAFLIVAVAGTTAYKAMHGVDTQPFPTGEFPSMPAPSWQPGATPGASTDPAGMLTVHKILGIAGMLGACADVFGDLEPLKPKAVRPGWWDTTSKVAALTSLICSAGLYGVGTACPPVTGTDWNDAGGSWSMAFGFSVGSFAVGAGTWARSFRKGETPYAKNYDEVVLGPILVGIFATGFLAASGKAIHDSGTNPYSAAAIGLSAIPGVLQPLRIGLNPRAVTRGSIIAAVDALAAFTSTTMTTVAAFVEEAPVITTTDLPRATVGVRYSTMLTADGGTRVFNRPLKGWQVAAAGDPLPPGLELDPDTGHLHGMPTKAMSATIEIICTDSYGPPQPSSPVRLRLTVDQ